MIAVGVVCGLMVGWFACSMCGQARMGDLMAQIDETIESRDSWAAIAGNLAGQIEILRRATRTQFKKRAAK